MLVFFFTGEPTSTPFGFHTRPTGTICGAQQYVCKNLKCVDKAQICNFKDDCGDNSDEIPCGTTCTFEDECYKGWRQSTGTDVFKWKRRQGQTPSTGTGPSTDHTLGTAQVLPSQLVKGAAKATAICYLYSDINISTILRKCYVIVVFISANKDCFFRDKDGCMWNFKNDTISSRTDAWFDLPMRKSQTILYE